MDQITPAWANLVTTLRGRMPDYPPDQVRLFSPVDSVHDAITSILSEALIPGGTIKVNMYGYDDDDVDKVLHSVAARHDTVFMMNLDKTQAAGVHEKALLQPWATSEGTSVAIGQSAKHAISHLKVAVVNGLYVISGSTNWSLSGEEKQDNELVITMNRVVAQQYTSIIEFNHLVMLKQMGKN